MMMREQVVSAEAEGIKTVRALALIVFILGYAARVLAGMTLFTDVYRMEGQFLHDPVWSVAGSLITGISAGVDLSEGQPLFTFVLAGMRVVSGDNGTVLLLILSLFGAASCAATFLICYEVASNRAVALAASAVLCVFPSQLRYDLYMFDQAMFTALYAWAVLLLVRFLQHQQMKFLVAFALVLSLAYLTRATVQLFAVVAAVVIAASAGWRAAALRRVIVFLAVFFLPVFAWGVRNYLSFGEFGLSDSDKWYLVYLGNNELTWQLYPEYGVGIMEPYALYKWNEYLRDKPELRTMARRDPYVKDYVYRVLLFDYIRENPFSAIKMNILKFLHFFSPIPIPRKGHLDLKYEDGKWIPVSSETSLSRYKTLVYLVTFTPLLLLSVIGSVVLMKVQRPVAVVLIAAIVTQAIVTALVGASSRYTALTMPFFCVLAVVGAQDIWKRIIKKAC